MPLLFGNKRDPVLDDDQLTHLVNEIRSLSGDVAALRGEEDFARQRLELAKSIETLTLEKSKLTIQLDQVQEKHARENREIEHKIGLHKKQVELEIEVARRKTELEVKELGLKEQRERFDENMEFQRERFEGEVEATRKLMEQILQRLPTVTVERKYSTTEHFGDEAPKPRIEK